MSRFQVGLAELSLSKTIASNTLASCALLAIIGAAPAIAADGLPVPASATQEQPVAAPNTAPKVSLPYKLITAPTQAEPAQNKPLETKQVDSKPVQAPASAVQSSPIKPADVESATAPAAPKTVAPQAVAAPAVAPKPEPPKITLNIDVDLTKQRMTLTEYDKVVGSWPISSGAEGHRSPTGTFRPVWSSKMWYSKQYDNAPMPHAVFFNGGVAMHATQSVGRLGTPASHGCIRQSPANAATTYKLVAKHGNTHTKIVVHGKPKDDEPRIARRDRNNDREAANPRYARNDSRASERSERQTMRRVIMVDGYGNRRITEIPANDPRLAAYNNRSYGGGYGRAW